MEKPKYFFGLGGCDNEMQKGIAARLTAMWQPFMTLALRWGAKASAYQPFFAALTAQGYTLVLIECEVDCDLPKGTIVIDHHNERAGEPASIIQVCNILNEEPTVEECMIGASDAGGWRALIREGFTLDEAKAFGDGGAKLPEAVSAEIDRAWAAHEVIGDLTIVRMSHSKTVAAIWRYAGEYEKIIYLSEDGEMNFYDDAATARALQARFGGWTGGEGMFVPEYPGCFWGKGGLTPAEQEEVLRFVLETLAN